MGQAGTWVRQALGKYGKYDDDQYQKDKYLKKDYEKWPDDKGGWGGSKKYKDDDDKKWGYKDSDCDPPVATPEPATLLLLGSSLAAAGGSCSPATAMTFSTLGTPTPTSGRSVPYARIGCTASS